MNVVDALCRQCGKPIRALSGTLYICRDCAEKPPKPFAEEVDEALRKGLHG